jgi:outer membrane receptor protein involved in Fe transport
LDEIVVTGTAGAARRREVGNTIAQINTAAVVDRPLQVTDVLTASAPGVDVASVGGEIGQGQQIRLRGNSSVSMSNQPIIYIDGVRIQSKPFPQTSSPDYPYRGANITSNPLNDINPNDIERIEVIKGSAATTLYGTEASAGVIQIFTKRGATGAPVWTFETQQGTSWSREFGTPEFPLMRMDPFLRNGRNGQYSASVRGGAQGLQYFVSGEHDREIGILPQDTLRKYVVRGNFTFTPISDLALQWNSTYANQWQRNTPVGGNAQGIILNAVRGAANYFSSDDPDVLRQLFVEDIEQRIERFTSGGTATFTPLTNQSNRLTIGYDYSQQEARNLRPFAFVLYPQGSLLNNTWQDRILTFDYVGTFSFGLTEHLKTDFSWGGQAVGDEQRSLQGWGRDFPGAAEPTVSSAAVRIADETREKVWNAGFFFQDVLNFYDRYFITLGLRVDGNSAFGSGFGLQTYPKASASWVVSDESWWNKAWGTVKLRTAYGQSGRAPGAFDAVRTWQAHGWAGKSAFIPQNVGNPDIGPEVTAELEMGYDASWFGDRLSSTFTYYHQKTSQALFNVTQIPSNGFLNSQLENAGKLQNVGIELGLNGSPIRGRSWGWDVGVNVTTNHSEVLSLGGAPPFSLGNGGWVVEGQPVPVMRGRYVSNPDAIADPIIVQDHNYGPNQPTLTIAPSTTLRLPHGVSLSARGDYKGGMWETEGLTAGSVSRSAKWPICWPYYEDPGNSIALKADTPALWRARCTPKLVKDDYTIEKADFFRLRSVSAEIPLDFLFPDRVSNSVLTLALNNSFSWYNNDWLILDPEMMGDFGAQEQVVEAGARVPSPISFHASLRVQF